MTRWIMNTYQGNVPIGDGDSKSNDLDYFPDNLELMDIVMCKLRDGTEHYSRGYYLDWKKYGKGGDIMEYRVLTQEEFKRIEQEVRANSF